MAIPAGAAAAVGAVFVSTLVPAGATVLQGAQLHVGGPAGASPAATAHDHLLTTQAATVTASDPTGGTTGGTTSTSAPPTTSTSSAPAAGAANSYLSPAAPSLPAGTAAKPVKVLLVGDSVAGTLGVGLAAEGKQYGVQLVNEGTPGCSLSMQAQFRALYYTVTPDPPCDANGDPNGLLATWRQWVDAYNPDVVVYVGRGETFDQQVWGQWQNLGESAFDSYVADRFRQAIGVLGSKGASVVLMTTPYYDSGLDPAGSRWPEDDPSRVATDNTTIRAVASAASGAGNKVYVFDLNQLVTPGGQFSATVGSINVRCADGVHFSASGGIFVGQRLAPELAALGQGHAASSPGGAWPGALPPSTPSWFSKLPCQ